MKKLLILPILLCLITAPAYADCVIGEYAALSDTASGQLVSVATRLIETQELDNSSEVQSAAFNAATRYIRVACDEKTHFLIGADPTADTSDQWVGAGLPEYFGAAAGEKISVLTGS